MGNIIIKRGRVFHVESNDTKNNYDGLRIKAFLPHEIEKVAKQEDFDNYPWYFPLMPKTFQTVPKKDELVLILFEEGDNDKSQGYYIGPIISQPQFQEDCYYTKGTSLLNARNEKPLAGILTGLPGSFPNSEDVAVEGRGKEDIILRYREDKTSEIDIRAGIRKNPNSTDDKNIVGNVIFNNTDPAYIQLKYKAGLASKQKNQANSVINMIADRINIISNKDNNINSEDIHNPKDLVTEENMDNVMDKLHQVPMGDKLVELLKIMKGAIMHHVHPWAGMEQCGDWPGYINKLDGYDIDSILSEYVRIS
jgi:hypothetical protein